MLPAYAPAGTPMKLSVLVSVATMVKQIAHQGTERSGQEVVARGLLESGEPGAKRGDRQQVAAR